MVLPKAEIDTYFGNKSYICSICWSSPQFISVILSIPLPLRALHRTSWWNDPKEKEAATWVKSFSNHLWNQSIPTRGSPLWNGFQNTLKSAFHFFFFSSQKFLIQHRKRGVPSVKNSSSQTSAKWWWNTAVQGISTMSKDRGEQPLLGEKKEEKWQSGRT